MLLRVCVGDRQANVAVAQHGGRLHAHRKQLLVQVRALLLLLLQQHLLGLFLPGQVRDTRDERGDAAALQRRGSKAACCAVGPCGCSRGRGGHMG